MSVADMAGVLVFTGEGMGDKLGSLAIDHVGVGGALWVICPHADSAEMSTTIRIRLNKFIMFTY